MRLTTILSALAALTLSAAPLAAEGHDEGRDCPTKGERHAKLLERFDANHDGKLDETERATAKQAFQEHRAKRQAEFKEKHPEAFAKVDTNGDGAIDQSERAAAKQKFLAKHPEADKNSDGKLGHCERHNLRQERRDRRGNTIHKAE